MLKDEDGRSTLHMTTTAKLYTLMAITTFLFMVWVVECIISLVTIELALAVYCACVTGVMVLGFFAAKKRLRTLLFCYILGIVIVIGFGVVGLTWWLIASVIKWSFDTPWLVVFVFNVFIILIEAASLLIAYSLTKDLDSKHVVTLGSPHPDGTSGEAAAHGEQAFAFQGGGSVEVDLQQPQHQPATYQPEWPATAYPPSPAAARMAYPQQQPYQPPQSPPMYSNTRGLAAPAPRDDDDMFFVPQTRAHYENDIIGGAPAHSTNAAASDDYNPFQDRF